MELRSICQVWSSRLAHSIIIGPCHGLERAMRLVLLILSWARRSHELGQLCWTEKERFSNPNLSKSSAMRSRVVSSRMTPLGEHPSVVAPSSATPWLIMGSKEPWDRSCCSYHGLEGAMRWNSEEFQQMTYRWTLSWARKSHETGRTDIYHGLEGAMSLISLRNCHGTLSWARRSHEIGSADFIMGSKEPWTLSAYGHVWRTNFDVVLGWAPRESLCNLVPSWHSWN